LGVYESQTAPVVDFYRNAGKLAHLNGVGSLDEVFTRITEALA
jgi:adenylate kinase